MLLTDYLLHWVDITRTWLADGGAGRVVTVQAVDSRVPGQPAEARNPWSATLSMTAATGATALLRIPGNGVVVPSPAVRSGCTAPRARCAAACCSTPTGSRSTTGTAARPYPLHGAWFVDGFAAAMGELMCAVAEDRQPENSAADAAESVRAGARRPGVRRARTALPWRSGR